MSQFQIDRQNFANGRVVEDGLAEAPLAPGAARVRIERFGYSSNNLTYAVTGEMLGYWGFFPPAEADAQGWGMTPTWGFGTVEASDCAEIAVGERLFGFFAPATHVDLLPQGVKRHALFDGSAHRAHLPPAYNRYSRVAAEPGYDAAQDEARMLLTPLYITGFAIAAWLGEQGHFGARRVLLLSASSKTSIGLAYALAENGDAPPVVGATSGRNRDFVAGLGLYAETVDYDALEDLDPSIPTVVVDMAGNPALRARLHAHLGGALLRCVLVGMTHWEQGTVNGDAEADTEFFFAPTHVERFRKSWGDAVFAQRTGAFLAQSIGRSLSWLRFTRVVGLAGLAEVHPAVCAGTVPPEQGLIVAP
ncbi:DUF2855 family protein [Massilia glaciei]|uniref:DUF2855 domain-containing protein n=1 Tax=Massilia glaciei TaxID=1524097 RepID=A0A2U2HI89_9BURK|nr:DUF2855 family protein [Massilia glaciei]PWF46034.1 DUF2855 domain-containing protein [Massilia glaciei]